MFSMTFFAAAVIFALGLQVNAHAGVAPALGVQGKLTRKDVQRPSTAKPCGKIALTNIDTSTPVIAAADGTMTINVTNFNGGKDGSREIKTLRIDATGTGKSFQAAPASAITKNGVAAPSSTGTEQLTVVMPAGTTCAGGKTKDLCLMSFTTDAGFGNCVVAQQATAAGATGAAADNSTTVVTGAVAGNSTTTNSGSCVTGKKAKKSVVARNDARAAGSRAARAYLV